MTTPYINRDALRRDFGVWFKDGQPVVEVETSRGRTGFVAKLPGKAGVPLVGAHAVVKRLCPRYSVGAARAAAAAASSEAARPQRPSATGGAVTGSVVEERLLRVCRMAAADSTGALRFADAAAGIVRDGPAADNRDWVEAVTGLVGWARAAAKAIAARGLVPLGVQVGVGAKHELIGTAIDVLCASDDEDGALVALELKTGFRGYIDGACAKLGGAFGEADDRARNQISMQAILGQAFFVRMTEGTYSPYTRSTPHKTKRPVRALSLVVNNEDGAFFVEPNPDLTTPAAVKALCGAGRRGVRGGPKYRRKQ